MLFSEIKKLSQAAACGGFTYHIINGNSAQKPQGKVLPLFQDQNFSHRIHRLRHPTERSSWTAKEKGWPSIFSWRKAIGWETEDTRETIFTPTSWKKHYHYNVTTELSKNLICTIEKNISLFNQCQSRWLINIVADSTFWFIFWTPI